MPTILRKLKHQSLNIAHQHNHNMTRFIKSIINEEYIYFISCCKKCGLEKDVNDFHLDKRAKDKHHYFCKTCRSIKRYKHIIYKCFKK